MFSVFVTLLFQVDLTPFVITESKSHQPNTTSGEFSVWQKRCFFLPAILILISHLMLPVFVHYLYFFIYLIYLGYFKQ
jgi:hypothetical protein